jgi:hypothetical protein
MEVLQISQDWLCGCLVLLSGVCQTLFLPGGWAVLDPNWTQFVEMLLIDLLNISDRGSSLRL